MKYLLYEIRNNINGKIYVGVHKTVNIDDGYMGSGKVIIRAIEKHGLENFTKTILEKFETQEEMFARETEVVDDDFLAREDTYNLRRGGMGGWDYLNKTGLNNSKKTKEQMIEYAYATHKKINDDPLLRENRRLLCLKNLENNMASGKMNYMGMLGKKHSEEHKKLLSTIMLEKQNGDKNSQFGTMWITNEVESKKIKKDELVPDGWHRGRKYVP